MVSWPKCTDSNVAADAAATDANPFMPQAQGIQVFMHIFFLVMHPDQDVHRKPAGQTGVQKMADPVRAAGRGAVDLRAARRACRVSYGMD